MPPLLISEYAAHLQAEKRLAEASCRSYLGAARSLLKLCSREPERLLLPPDWSLASLDKRTLELYLNHLRRERGWHEPALARHASTLRTFFAYLHERGLIERNPMRSLLPRAPRVLGALPGGGESAVRALLEAAPPTLAGARLQLLVELIYGAALRPSHAYALQALQVTGGSPARGSDQGSDQGANQGANQGSGRRAAAGAVRSGSAGRKQGPAEEAASSGTLELEWEDRAQSLPVSQAGRVRALHYLTLRAKAAADRPETPFWVNQRGAGCSPAQLSRELSRAMEGAGLPGKPSELRQLAARHFRERGGDTRSLQTLLGARGLGSLDRYGPTRLQDIVRQFRKAHPRQQDRGD